ncbi:hypothetical protein M2G39_22200 [Vibrio vulnificus]|nr:hypothetical protein [Vibrio vulnificus]MCG6296197.1 hypothetical protein [Vibrio vulnificus]MCG6305507.1 hypothetical protein [Vibrio vulnificus]MCU8133329.1 hypothetical protein [Vibrio vulnificus]MCU8168289.1 hypothetical protein [Vibrio vulnificus]
MVCGKLVYAAFTP